jgi:hypothetical protein
VREVRHSELEPENEGEALYYRVTFHDIARHSNQSCKPIKSVHILTQQIRGPGFGWLAVMAVKQDLEQPRLDPQWW